MVNDNKGQVEINSRYASDEVTTARHATALDPPQMRIWSQFLHRVLTRREMGVDRVPPKPSVNGD
jgi:hypothetical protein